MPLIGPGRTLRFVLLPGGQDPDELLRSGGAGALEQAMSAPLPLVEMLWRRETQERPLDTPERRASLERRLAEVAGQIQDAALRRYYGQDLSTRLSKLSSNEFSRAGARSGRQRKRFHRNRLRPPLWRERKICTHPGMASGPVRVGAALADSPALQGRQATVSAHECLLLVLVDKTALLADHPEDLAAMDFEAHAKADALRRSDGARRIHRRPTSRNAASTHALGVDSMKRRIAPFPPTILRASSAHAEFSGAFGGGEHRRRRRDAANKL